MAASKNRYSWLAHQPMQQKILIAIATLVLRSEEHTSELQSQ